MASLHLLISFVRELRLMAGSNCGLTERNRGNAYPCTFKYHIEPQKKRELTIAHARRKKIKMDRVESGRKRNMQSSGDGRGKAKQEKAPEPYTRHPDDYYVYGPYGPYAYRLPVVGKLKHVRTQSEDYVTMWSSVRDLEEQQRVIIYNAIVAFDRAVHRLDMRIGLQDFLVFVRLPFRYGNEVPWKQWTLVSQVTLESSELLDKFNLPFKLPPRIRDQITHYTGWFRPDLIYVKNPKYQVRFEPEKEFIKELKKLLAPVGESHEKESFYGQFCKILEVDVDSGHEEIIFRYEQSREEVQLAVLEHILTNNPIQLLHPYPYPRPGVWMRKDIGMPVLPGGQLGVMAEASTASSTSSLDGSHKDDDEEINVKLGYDDFIGKCDADDNQDDDGGTDADDAFGEDDLESTDEWVSDIQFSINTEEKSSSFAMENSLSDDDEREGDINDFNDFNESSKEQEVTPVYGSVLKAAVRPFTYVNFVRELVMLRFILLERKRAG